MALAPELKEVTRNISSELGGVVGNIRKTANDNQKMFSVILKDIGKHFEVQNSGLLEVSESVEQSSNKVAAKVDSTNSLLQDSLGLLSNTYAELRTMNSNIKVMNNNLGDNNKSLIERLGSGFKGLQNVIIGGLASAAPAVVGFAGGVGGGLLSGMGGKETDSSVGKGSAEFQNVAPRVIKDLQRDFPGLTKEDASAIVGNLGEESAGFSQMKEAGGQGPGRGWAQWTSPDRKAKFLANVQKHGGDIANYDANYETLRDELRGQYSGALKATMAAQGLQNKTQVFMEKFENPGVPHFDVRARYAQRAMNVSENTSPTTDASPVAKQSATQVHATESGHAGHEGIITGKQKAEENMSSSEAKEFLQSRGGAQQGAVGVNAERLDGDFAEKMAKAIKAAESATGSKVTITEGYRDPHVQAQYYSDYIGKPITYDGKTYQPNPAKLGRLAAPPGRSRHQKGMAMDLAESPAREWLIQNAGKFGIESLFAKIGKDKPHFQAPGGGGEEGQGPTLQEASFQQGANISSISPGAGSSVDDRIATINENINKLGGGVTGPGAEEQPAPAPSIAMGIPAHGMAMPVNIQDYTSKIDTMAIAASSPAASMVPGTPKTSDVINQSQLETQVEDHTYKEAMRVYTEQTKKQTEEISSSQLSTGTQYAFDYNNAGDTGWPDWAALIGGWHWEETKKIKQNMHF